MNPADHETSFTLTKIIRQPNPTNWQTFPVLHALLHDLEKCAKGSDTTILPNTLRLETHRTTYGLEVTLHAFAKPVERK